MLKVGDRVIFSNATQVGKFRGKIIKISEHSVYLPEREPLYKIKYDSSKSQWHYEKDLLRIVVICA